MAFTSPPNSPLGNVRVETLNSPNGATSRETGPTTNLGPADETYAARLEQTGPWRTNGNLPASQAATFLTMGVASGVDSSAQTALPLWTDATLVGMVIRGVQALTAGTLTVSVQVNGTNVYTQAFTSADGSLATPVRILFPTPLPLVNSGQRLISVKMQTDASYAPTTSSFNVWLIYRWTA